MMNNGSSSSDLRPLLMFLCISSFHYLVQPPPHCRSLIICLVAVQKVIPHWTLGTRRGEWNHEEHKWSLGEGSGSWVWIFITIINNKPAIQQNRLPTHLLCLIVCKSLVMDSLALAVTESQKTRIQFQIEIALTSQFQSEVMALFDHWLEDDDEQKYCNYTFWW